MRGKKEQRERGRGERKQQGWELKPEFRLAGEQMGPAMWQTPSQKSEWGRSRR